MRALSFVGSLLVILSAAACGPSTTGGAPPQIRSAALSDGYRGEPFSLSVSAEGGTPPYTWTRSAGAFPEGVTLSASGELAGTPTTVGSFAFTVTVEDASGAEATAGLTISVFDPVAFTASQLADAMVGQAYSQTVALSGGKPPVTLVTTAALPDGLSWSAPTLSGTPTIAGDAIVALTATDANGRTTSAQLPLAIRAPLEMAAVTAPTAYVGGPYALALSASGGATPYRFEVVTGSLPAGLAIANGEISGTPTTVGNSTFEVRVIDANGFTAQTTATIDVVMPSLQLTTAALPDGYRTRSYTASLVATGGDAPFTFALAAGALPDGLTLTADGALSGTPTASAGTTELGFTVTDVNGQRASRTLSLAIYEVPIATAAFSDGYVGLPTSQAATVTGGKAPLTWALLSGSLPGGLSLSDSGILSGTPTAAGTNSFALVATDANGINATVGTSMTVYAQPSVSGAPPGDGYVSVPFSHQAAVSGGKAPFTWAVASGLLPPGVTFSEAGALGGTPTTAGSWSFEVRVTDANLKTASQVWTVVVYALPVVSTGDPADAYVSSQFSHQATATGGKAPFTWSVAGELPAGLAFTWEGLLSGTPQVEGTSPVEVTVTDANGRSASRAWDLAVYALPAFASAAPPEGYVSVELSHTASVTGGKTPITWSVSSGELPPGVSLSSSTGVLSGSPTMGGSYPFSLTASDANARTVTIAWTMEVYALPVVGTADPADTYVGESLSYQATVSGGKAPFEWAVSTGVVPDGLTFTPGGLLSGSPTSSGSTALELRVTDANGQSASRTVSVDVFTLPVITTTALADGTVGRTYLEQLEVSGGEGPLTFTVIAGALPDGLTLHPELGVLGGTPTTEGSFAFTAQVADANGRTDDQAFTVTIAPGVNPAVLAVANWNIEWFGDTGKGPVDEALQLENATGVITDAGFDVVGVAEIVDTAHFNALVAGLPGYAGFLANDATVTDGTTHYSTGEQKVGFLYDSAKVQVLSSAVVLGEYSYEFAGRPPLRVDARITVDGVQSDVTFMMVHLKAFADEASRTRRAASAAALKSYIDTYLASANVLVIGDFNDDVDESIVCDSTTGTCADTPFRNFIDDAANYLFVTTPLSEAGLRSTVSYDNVIDHHLATNEMSALYFGPSEVVRPDLWTQPVANYGETTSDHYPVLTRYDLTGSGGGTAPSGDPTLVYLNEIRYDEPGTTYSQEFVEIRNAGPEAVNIGGWSIRDTDTVRHVFLADTILSPGQAIVVFGGASALDGTVPNAVAASSGSLSLHSPADSVTLTLSDGTVRDTFSYSSSPGDGVSVNRSPDGDPAGAWDAHFNVSPSAASSSPGRRADGTDW